LADVLARFADIPQALASPRNTRSTRRLIMAAIAHVFTIGYVAEMLGENEERLHELSIDMFPEDGCLHVYTSKDEAITAFTDEGIECPKQIIADLRSIR
jgi:hypothetical protein